MTTKNNRTIKINCIGPHFYTVNPSFWGTYTDQQLTDAYNHFFEWVIMNEEEMLLKEAEKAWKTLDKWKKVCLKRGIALDALHG